MYLLHLFRQLINKLQLPPTKSRTVPFKKPRVSQAINKNPSVLWKTIIECLVHNVKPIMGHTNTVYMQPPNFLWHIVTSNLISKPRTFKWTLSLSLCSSHNV